MSHSSDEPKLTRLQSEAKEFRRRNLCPVCESSLAKLTSTCCPQCQCILRFRDRRLFRDTVVSLDRQVRALPFARDVYSFVHDAAKVALDETAKSRGSRQADERELCEAVINLAFRRFGDKAASQFGAWGIANSDHVGQIVHALATAGFFSWSSHAESTLQAFHGMFEVGDRFWQAVWDAPDVKRGKCITCGYDLRGTPTLICPECGTNHF